MSKRSDFAQKLLDDLRWRKQQMGLAQANGQHADIPTSDTYGSSRRSLQGSGKSSNTNLRTKNITSAEITMKPSNRRFEVAPREIVLHGKSKSDPPVDLSMAIALAFSKTGTQINVELTGNRIGNAGILLQKGNKGGGHVTDSKWLLTAQLPFPSLSHIEEICKSTQKLNMILKPYANGNFFVKDSNEIGRKLLKGAKDLEESLKMLLSLQEASGYMVKPQRKQAKLLKYKEADNSSGNEVEQSIGSQKSSFDNQRFSLLDSRKNIKCSIVEKNHFSSKQDKSKLSQPTFCRSDRRIANCSPGLKFDSTFSNIQDQNSYNSGFERNSDSKIARMLSNEENSLSTEKGATKIIQQSTHGSLEREKIRIPNVIAKLMGLEELPPPEIDTKTSDVKIIPRQKYGSGNNAERVVQLEKNSSLENQRKGFDKLRNVSSQMHSAPVTGKGKYLKELKNKETETLMVRDTQKPLLDINVEKMAPSKDKGKIVLRKQTVDQVATEALKERKNIDQVPREPSKQSMKSERKKGPRTSHRKADAKNTQRELAGNSKAPSFEQRLIASKISSVGSQQSRSAKSNELQRAYQRSVERATTGNKNNEENKMGLARGKKINQLHEKLTKYMASQKSLKLTSSRPINVASNRRLDQVKILSDVEHTEGTIINNQSTMFIEIDQKIQNGSIEMVQLLMKDKKAQKEKFISLVPLKENMEPAEISVLENRNLGLSMSTSGISEDTNKEISKVSVTAKNDDHVFEKHAAALLTPEESGCEGVKSDGFVGICRALNVNQYLPETSELAYNKSATDSTVLAEEEQNNKAEIKKPIGDGITTTKNVGNQQLQERYPEDSSLELQSSESEESHLDGMNDGKQAKLCDNTRQADEESAAADGRETLTDEEAHLMEILTGNRMFLNTAKALFNIRIPPDAATEGSKARKGSESNLALDCGYEVMKRKGRREELMLLHSPRTSPSEKVRVRSLEGLIKELNGDIGDLKTQRRSIEREMAEEDLREMVGREIESRNPDVNCMWDLGWAVAGVERGEVVREVERHILSALVAEVVADVFEL